MALIEFIEPFLCRNSYWYFQDTPGSSVAACLWAPRVQALDELASVRSAEDAAILPSKKININK